MTLRITAADGAGDMAAVAGLFRDYAATLPIDLSHQGFEAELAALPGPYGAPDGAVLIARDDTGVLGCIAIKQLEPGVGEIKRLYLKPQARGLGLGKALIRAILDEAARLGYGTVKLDTLPHMQAAIALYQGFGFAPCAPYGSHPYPGLLCFSKALDARE
jgi:GNAT superfamily N-acetyltransferase